MIVRPLDWIILKNDRLVQRWSFFISIFNLPSVRAYSILLSYCICNFYLVGSVKRQLLLLCIFGFIIIVFQPPTALGQDFADVCQQPENILPNCNFDNGLDHWQTFIESGAAHFDVLQGGGECHAPLCPAAYIVTEDHFVGGLYQQAPVVKGNTYYANVVWLVFDSLTNDASIYEASGGIGRRIGIDPFGGTDPNSSTVVWGPDVWRNDCKICNVEEVTATAQADTITVFLRIEDTWRLRIAEKGYQAPSSKDQFWIDDIGLKQVEGGDAQSAAPIDAPPPPTDTPPPPPPTDTPVPSPPTGTPTPEPPTDTPSPATETPAEIAPLESAESQPVSPGQTPSPASKAALPPTLTPTMTPWPTPTTERPSPTPTRRYRPDPSPPEPPVLSAGLLGMVGTTMCVGGIVLVMMAALLAGLIWLYRLGWGQVEDDEFDDDFDDAEEIIVEIVE